MKITRRRVYIALACVGVAAVLFSPTVYWRLVGWVKGEAFFDGRPTSYWRRAFAGYAAIPVTNLSGVGVPSITSVPFRSYTSTEFAYFRACELIGKSRLGIVDTTPEMSKRPDALPMLLVLLDDENPRVRWLAAWLLATLGKHAAPALPALQGLLTDHAAVDAESPAVAAERSIRIISDDVANR